MIDYLKYRIVLLRAIDKIKNKPLNIGKKSVKSTIGEVVDKLVRYDALEDYLSLSADKPGRVSYPKTPVFRNDSKNRINTTVHRYFYRKLSDQFSESHIDAYCNNLVAELKFSYNLINIVEGEELVEYYKEEWGQSSCMTKIEAIRHLDIYKNNPDIVKLLVYWDSSESIKARALMWHIDDKIILDRIYPNSGQHISVIEKIAKEKGWILRKHNSAYLCYNDEPLHDEEYCAILNIKDINTYPYLDSFQSGSICGNKLKLYNSEYGDYVFISIDGNKLELLSCHNCGVKNTKDNLITIDEGYLCIECYNE